MDFRSHEVGVLKVLSDLGSASPAEVAGVGDVDESGVMRAGLELQEKGLVEIEESSEIFFEIGGEGRRLLEYGLPEDRVLSFVGDGVSSLGSLSQELEGDVLNIGLGWIRDKGLGEIVGGEIKLTDKGRDRLELEEKPELKVLRFLSDEPKSMGSVEQLVDNPESILDELLSRNQAVQKVEKVSRELKITDKGRKVVRDGLDRDFDNYIHELTPELISSGEWREREFRKYDVTASTQPVYPGKRHPYQLILDDIRRIFRDMGFKEIKGRTVESSFWNFDALFQPQDHPAREMQDTFYLETPNELDLPDDELVSRVKKMHEEGGELDSTGWRDPWSRSLSKKAVLRTHTTSTTISYLARNPRPPEKVFSIDRAYRRETIDATHLPQFYQLEGIVLGEKLSFNNLLGYLSTFYSRMGFDEIRFRPGYFPYTEPSVEPEVYVEELGEWVELGGAGVFRREVTKPIGVEHPVLAWGLGIGRLAMLKLGLTDLRDLYQSDIDWLRRNPTCRL
ncbi:Phenylalanyl-tRNA synthetase alpha subunit [Methanonatronarchaeum thermophilum]|uniref:Phenylalanine--tRNA ligase alpha subunit n=1 Tax=Methanonatronarchaeum thermophilum TaxID=1927129 RepID=A0A1Y3GCT3_9EURY|nr:phenylalanine--tRNA ligase subunit alpha [Methanonatronarchaeum thermophilum]OUJ19258.1 Phenylalanyl-tRNA synthetase alpha subunit [Methanonatronarchaeum thermophilum]